MREAETERESETETERGGGCAQTRSWSALGADSVSTADQVEPSLLLCVLICQG